MRTRRSEQLGISAWVQEWRRCRRRLEASSTLTNQRHMGGLMDADQCIVERLADDLRALPADDPQRLLLLAAIAPQTHSMGRRSSRQWTAAAVGVLTRAVLLMSSGCCERWIRAILLTMLGGSNGPAPHIMR